MAATQRTYFRIDNITLQYGSSNVVKFDLLTVSFLVLISNLKLNIFDPLKTNPERFFFDAEFVSDEQ